MRKSLLALLAISILGISVNIDAINQASDELEQSEVPMLSPKQLSKQMRDFRRYVNRVRRCMFTGPCTKKEMTQVRRHGWYLLKALGVAGAGALLYYYRAPIKGWAETKAQAGEEALKRKAKEMGAAAGAGLAEQVRGLGVKVQPQYGGPGSMVPVGFTAEVQQRGEQPAAAPAEPQRRRFPGEPLEYD